MNVSQPTPPNLNLPEPVDTPIAPAASMQQAAPAAHAPAPQLAAAPQRSDVSPQAQYGDTLSQSWIHAVENAIRQGVDDPRVLSMQLDELRAQYIAGRYAKEVKRQAGKGE